MVTVTADTPGFWNGTRRFARFLAGEMKPRGRLLTPFNVITVADHGHGCGDSVCPLHPGPRLGDESQPGRPVGPVDRV